MFDTDYDYEPYENDLDAWEEEQVFLDNEGDADLDPAAREFLSEAEGSDEDGEDEDGEFDAHESEDSWLDGSYEG